MVCPVCNHENEVLSFYCESCYNILSNKNALLFNENVKKNLEKTDDKNIFRYGNVFLILHEFNNVLLDFGEFLNFDDALDKKTELEDNGWPIPMDLINNDEETISNNIYKKDGKYYVFNIIEGKKKIFGRYSTKKEATIAKYKFIEDNWGKSKDNNIPKYIHKTPAGTFRIARRIHGKDVRFGTFPTLEDAVFVKSLIIEKNWKVGNFSDEDCIYENDGQFYVIKPTERKTLKIHGKYASFDEAKVYSEFDNSIKIAGRKEGKYGSNIYKTPAGTFRISKKTRGNELRFGTFLKLEDAVFVKSLIIERNWDIGNFSDEDCIYENDGQFYVIKPTENGALKIHGKYDTFEKAEIFKDVDNSIKFSNKKESQYGTYIYKVNDGDFAIHKSIDGVQRNFGSFKNLEVAQFVKEVLVDNNWDVDYFLNNNIFEINGKFYVIILIRSHLRVEGVFSYFEEAEDFLANLDYGNILHHAEKFLYKQNNKFIIQKNVDDGTFQAKFDDLDLAIAVRDFLIKIDWNLDYFDSLNNILEIDGKFHVFFRRNRMRFKILASFDTLEEALNHKDEFIESFNESSKDIKFSNWDRNIHKRNNGFAVVKRIDGTLKSFGTFDTREEAIAVRDELVANNWNVENEDNQEKQELLNPDILNEIIFRLTPWQKIVFDAINELNSNNFKFEDLKQFEKNFKRFTAPSKVDSKVLQNLDQLIDLGLLVRTDENTYQKLWNY